MRFKRRCFEVPKIQSADRLSLSRVPQETLVRLGEDRLIAIVIHHPVVAVAERPAVIRVMMAG